MRKKKPTKSQENETKVIKLVKQANGLIEARYNFSIWEMRLFKTMVSLIKPSDQEFKKTIVPIKDILDEYEMGNSGFAYGLVKEAYKNLKKRFVYVPYINETGQKRLQIMPLFTLIDIPLEIRDVKDSYVILKFNDDLQPFLLQVQNRYTLYDPIILKNIDSSYTVRIYELLKEYEFRGEAKIELEEFREMIGTKEYDEDFNIIKDTFKVWQDLKRYVIIPAHKDINSKTDICFEYEPIFEKRVGKGRKAITGIYFKDIKPNPNRQENTLELANKKINNTLFDSDSFEAKDDDFQEIYSLVNKYVSKSNVKKWLKEVPKEQILKGIQFSINYIQAGNQVNNIGGLIRNMIYTPNIIDPVQVEKQKKQTIKAKKEQEQQLQEQTKQKEAETQKIKLEYEQAKKQTLKVLFESQPNLASDFLQTLRAERAKEQHEFIVEIAHDNYKTNIPNIIPNSKEEILHNYELGGSFGAYLLDWIEKRFPEYQLMK